MPRASASAALSVERFFEFSLLGLVASGYLAVAGSGYLDFPTVALTAAGLVLRALLIYGVIRLEISDRTSTIATLCYAAFYLIDYLFLSRQFLSATVHLVFFLAVVKILTAKTNRDHLYTAVIAFLEIVAAAILSINFNFFAFLIVYLLFAIAALTSGEIRRSLGKAAITARPGRLRFQPRLASLAICITLGILTLTAGLFFLLPRTADAAFASLVPRRFHLPGFSNQLSLGEIGEIKTTSRPMMHIRAWGNAPQGLKWRGGVLVDFDGKRWYNSTRAGERVFVSDGSAPLVDSRAFGTHLNYTVQYDDLETNALFFIGAPESISRLRVPAIYRMEGGTYRLGRTPESGFQYDAYSRLDVPPELVRSTPFDTPETPVLSLADRERYLALPTIDSRIPELARTAAGPAKSDLMRARSMESYLRQAYGYTLKLPSREVPDPLAYFLFTRKQGHCEYFASAMTVMLRTIGIPARIATGFQSGVYNPLTELWLIRASDAHTWVEAWIPRYGWATFDPTPPDPAPAGAALLTKLSLYLDAAETFWSQWVVGYDASQQGSLADRLGQGAFRSSLHWFDSLAVPAGTAGFMAWLRAYWAHALAFAVWFVLMWILGPRLLRMFREWQQVSRVRRGEGSVADATLLYQRMLRIMKRHGYQKPAWFTPQEFAGSLAGTPLGGTVGEFTAAYNEVRFGGKTDAAPRLPVLLAELERSERRRR